MKYNWENFPRVREDSTCWATDLMRIEKWVKGHKKELRENLRKQEITQRYSELIDSGVRIYKEILGEEDGTVQQDKEV